MIGESALWIWGTHGTRRPCSGWRETDTVNLLDGWVVATTTAIDEPLPGGPRRVERKYLAPSARANREEDYRITWEHFGKMKREG